MRVFPIVFTCDDQYFKYTDVVITSILSNQNRNVHYEIHILTEFISEENKQKAISQLRPHKNTVFYKMEDLAVLGESEIQRYRRKI